MQETKEPSHYEIMRGVEQSVGHFFVRFHVFANPLIGRNQTVIEVRYNGEKLPLLSKDEMEDPMIDQQKPRVFTADREFTLSEQESFLKSLEQVNHIDTVFLSLVK